MIKNIKNKQKIMIINKILLSLKLSSSQKYLIGCSQWLRKMGSYIILRAQNNQTFSLARIYFQTRDLYFSQLFYQLLHTLIHIKFMSQANKNRGWTEYEDKLIIDLVSKYGEKNWAKIVQQLHLVHGHERRTGKQCRQRWHNHLNPTINKHPWTKEQQDIIFEQHRKHGNKWTAIALRLPGRTDNAVKNYFYSSIRKSLRRISKFMGSKNSTMKMRQIKPSTLSQIFSFSESKNNYHSQQPSNSEVDCKQIAHCLIDFSRQKLADKKYKISPEDYKKFDKILEQMMKINKNHQSQKLLEAKNKKQDLLKKKFDQVVQSQEDEQPSSSQQDQLANNLGSNDNLLKTTDSQFVTKRSHRKVKPPCYYDGQAVQQKKQKIKQSKQQKEQKEQNILSNPIKQEQQNSYVLIKNLLNQQIESPIERPNPQQLCEYYHYQVHKQPQISNQFDENKFNIDISLESNQLPEVNQINISPNIGNFMNTPFALTPKIDQFMKESCYHYPLKNEDCNLQLNKIINQIQKNTNPQLQAQRRCPFLPSPSSAFRQCY